jgi:hypothetical protein
MSAPLRSPRSLSGRLPLLALCALLSGGCTLCKPVVGAITGPVLLLGSVGGQGLGNCDGRALGAALCVASVAGAASGLVTGIISDVRWIAGCAEPALNWHDPFRTND